MLQSVCRVLAQHASLFVTAVAVLTFFVPDLFLWVRGTTQTVILGIIMLRSSAPVGAPLCHQQCLAQHQWHYPCLTVPAKRPGHREMLKAFTNKIGGANAPPDDYCEIMRFVLCFPVPMSEIRTMRTVPFAV